MYDEKTLNKLEETSYKELSKIVDKGELFEDFSSVQK